MIVPAFGIELLGALEPLLGEVGLALLAEANGEFEGRFGFGFGGAPLLDAALVIFVGKHELAFGAFGYPVAQGGDVGVTLGPDDLAANFQFLVFGGRGFGGADDAALFVDPDPGGDVG